MEFEAFVIGCSCGYVDGLGFGIGLGYVVGSRWWFFVI